MGHDPCCTLDEQRRFYGEISNLQISWLPAMQVCTRAEPEVKINNSQLEDMSSKVEAISDELAALRQQLNAQESLYAALEANLSHLNASWGTSYKQCKLDFTFRELRDRYKTNQPPRFVTGQR